MQFLQTIDLQFTLESISLSTFYAKTELISIIVRILFTSRVTFLHFQLNSKVWQTLFKHGWLWGQSFLSIGWRFLSHLLVVIVDWSRYGLCNSVNDQIHTNSWFSIAWIGFVRAYVLQYISNRWSYRTYRWEIISWMTIKLFIFTIGCV